MLVKKSKKPLVDECTMRNRLVHFLVDHPGLNPIAGRVSVPNNGMEYSRW